MNIILNDDYESIKFEGCESRFDLALSFYDAQGSDPPIAYSDEEKETPANTGCNHQWATDLTVNGPINAGSYIFGIAGYQNSNGGEYDITLQCRTNRPTQSPLDPDELPPTPPPAVTCRER